MPNNDNFNILNINYVTFNKQNTIFQYSNNSIIHFLQH
jgi:hypothetical protein